VDAATLDADAWLRRIGPREKTLRAASEASIAAAHEYMQDFNSNSREEEMKSSAARPAWLERGNAMTRSYDHYVSTICDRFQKPPISWAIFTTDADRDATFARLPRRLQAVAASTPQLPRLPHVHRGITGALVVIGETAAPRRDMGSRIGAEAVPRVRRGHAAPHQSRKVTARFCRLPRNSYARHWRVHHFRWISCRPRFYRKGGAT